MAFNLSNNRATAAMGVLAAGLAAFAVITFALTGCGNFFVPPTTGTSGSTGTTGSTATDYAYFTNSAVGATSLNGYVVSSGTLVAATSSPYSIGTTPQSIVITQSNKFLYLASDSALTAGAIYGFSIGTGGALTILNSGSPLVAENSAAIEVSPDGKYLFSLNAISLTIEQYSLNTSTGFLSSVGNYPVVGAADGGIVLPTALKFAPSGNFLIAALGTGGAESFGYNTSTGALSNGSSINPGDSAIGIYGVAIDGNNQVYTVGTNTTASPGLQVFSATSAGILKPLSSINTGTIGNAAHSVVVNSANAYVYVGNYSDGTISAYSIGSAGALTALTGSPYNAPANVAALARDNSGTYILAAGYSTTSGFQMYSIGSGGALTSTNNAASGAPTSIPSSIAAAH